MSSSGNLGVSGRLARAFVDSRLTPLIAILLVLLGAFAVVVTPREEEPQINVTMANVFIPFPGASARDVETMVATPAEQVLSRISGIDHVFSVSRPELAIVTVQFKVGEDRTQALVRLYDTLNSNRDWVRPDLGVGEFLVKPVGIDDVPMLTLTLWSRDPAHGASDLGQVANAMEIELKRVPGTRAVATIGGAPRQIRVVLDVDRLTAFGLSTRDVRGALLAHNASLPSGHMLKDNREITVETGGFFSGPSDLPMLPIGNAGGGPVYLRDVARIEDGVATPAQYVWLGFGAGAGAAAAGEHAAVTLAITKKPGENAVSVADELLRRVETLRGSVVPAAVEVTVTRNYGQTANDKAMKLIQKLVFATLSVIALVWAALGRREAVVVGAAVLLTLAATLFASWAWGFTLNRVSLFALIFSIGILVDDAIVVVENIHRHAALTDADLKLSIPAAVDEVGGPTILATFTVIAALLPMAFVSGLMGPYMSPIPINSSLGMIISLAVAFVITPWLALRLLRRAPHGHGEAGATWLQRLFTRLLTPFLRGRAGRGPRWMLAVGVFAAIAVAVMLPAVQWVVLKMLPFDNKSEFQVVVDMPRGASLERTATVLHELGAWLARVPEVSDYEAYAGTASPINFNGLVRQYALRSLPYQGDIQVNLVDKHHRSARSHDIARRVRAPLQEIGTRFGANVKIVEVPPGPPVLSPIVAELYGPDYAAQQRVAKRIREQFVASGGLGDVDDSVDAQAPRLRLQVDRVRATQAGVAPQDLVAAVRTALGEDPVTPLHNGAEKYEVPVVLTLPREQAGRLDRVLRVPVRGADGTLIPLGELVHPVDETRDQTIYHKDLLPVVYIVADMTGPLDSPLYGMFQVRSALTAMALKEGGSLKEYFIRQPDDPYAGFAWKWDGEWQITYETFRDMGIAYAVGLLLIYLLVVAQFGSYITPLVIMAPIPLTVIGVMPGHALLHAQFTATSMIGMIALAGIIVRNSILLVDFINLQVSRGVAFQAAVVDAAATRAKPIVLTGAAAMLGALFIVDDPIFNGLAIALLFGILVSTLLTLIVIPVLYYAVFHRRWEHQATLQMPLREPTFGRSQAGLDLMERGT